MRRLLTLITVAALVVAGSAAVSRYTVRRGGTLSGVARRLGVSVDALARANKLKNINRIRAGQVLVVPGKPGTTSKLAPVKPPPAAKAGTPMAPIVSAHLIATGLSPTYVVQPG